MHCNSLLNDTSYLVENNESFKEDSQQQMYCLKHNRWFSSTISTSFDEQTNQLPEDILALHNSGHFNLDNNELFNNKMINGIQNANKQWAIDVNQTPNEQKQIENRKKNKIYHNDYLLDQQLPFKKLKKVYNQNALNLSTRLNHLPIHTSTATFKRQQFKNNENRFSANESHDPIIKTRLLPDNEQELNTTRKRATKCDQQQNKETAENLNIEQQELFGSTRSNEKKSYWFENLKLPKLVLQFITCVIASEDYRDHILRDVDEDEHVNSVSKVDTISKYLFPLTFILFNLVYWLYYYTERASDFEENWKDSEVFQII